MVWKQYLFNIICFEPKIDETEYRLIKSDHILVQFAEGTTKTKEIKSEMRNRNDPCHILFSS